MDSSMGKTCLGKDVIEISSDRNEGSGDWDSPEYKDTAGSGGKKEPEALVFHKMDTEEDSDWYIAQCFVNGLCASDGEINLEKNDNLISNDYAVKLCLEYEVRKGKKLVKKELMVLLRREIYFVQFIINPEEDEFELGLIFGRSFLRSANSIVNFEEGTITIKPDFDPFLLRRDEEGKPNLDDLETLLDFDFDEFNNDAGPSSSIGIPLTQEEAEKRALAYNISMRYEILEEVKPLGRDDIMKEDRNITMINYTEAEVTGWLVNVLCQVGFTTMSTKFLILEIPVDQDVPIVVGHGFLDTIGGNIDIPNNDEEVYVIKRNDMETPIYKSRPIGYQNNTNPAENMTLSTLESVINPFRKISVWKKATSGTYDHEAGSSRAKRSRNVETVEEALLPDVHHEFLEWRGCSREKKSRYNSRLATLLQKLIYSPQIVDWHLLHKIGCGDEIDQMLKISLKEAQSDEEIFFSVAWVRAFNIHEPIYPELCREFYATYEFDEVCADDDLQSKKIISFRLGGRAHSLTLLEFARRLGLYHAEELNEEGFDAYFQGGLRSDENFNAREY
ncbi:hypothetical protein Tco_0601391 [Tanacetum coccineum]